MSTVKNIEVIRDFTRIFKNEHHIGGIDHLFHEDFKHNFKMPLPPGLEGFKAIGQMMNTAFPDVLVTEEDIIASDDKVVERSSAVATHNGEMMGVPPSGTQVNWTEIHIYQLKDHKIIEHWVELSMMELMTQIGAKTTP